MVDYFDLINSLVNLLFCYCNMIFAGLFYDSLFALV